MVTQTFFSSGTFSVPLGVTSVVVKCWAPGGPGGDGDSFTPGGGGGGGAFAQATVSVTPLGNVSYTVGYTGQNASEDSTATFWDGGANVSAEPGTRGVNGFGGGTGGPGGTTGGSTGTVTHAGGDGDSGGGPAGGAGGGGAGTTTDGSAGTGVHGGAGGATGGGDGGNGGDAGGGSADGVTGNDFGGGGGGGDAVFGIGASAGNAKIEVTYLAAHVLTAVKGTFTETGNAAILLNNQKITAAVGTFTETGVAASLLNNQILHVTVGAFTWTRNPASLQYSVNRRLDAVVGAFTLSGGSGLAHRRLGAFAGNFALTGNSANLTYPTVTRGPVALHLTNTSVVLWWELTSAVGPNDVSYSAAGESTRYVLPQIREVRRPDNSPAYFARAAITDLTPGKLYSAVVRSYNWTAAPFVFETPDDSDALKFLVWGNSQSNFAALASLLEAGASNSVDGYWTVGGIVGAGEKAAGWYSFYDEMLPTMASGKALLGCRGVQEEPTLDGKAAWPFPSTDVNYFAGQVGCAYVVVLDSIIGLGRRTLATTQGEWFVGLTGSDEWRNAKYRIVLVHHPFRTTYWSASKDFGGGTGTDRYLFEELYPLLKQSGADLVLQGFSHSYQRGVYATDNTGERIHHVVTGGGGSPLHTTRAWNWGPGTDPWILTDAAAFHYLLLSLSPARLLVQAVDSETDALIDEFSISPHTLL